MVVRPQRVDAGLLERLLDDEFLRRAPPKSTGRERYGAAEAEALAAEWREAGRQADDLVATLVAFSVEAVRRACEEHLGGRGALERLLVGGGGARNPALLEGLAAALQGVPVEPFDAAGVPAQAAEAMRTALAVGADDGIHLQDAAFEKLDELQMAAVLRAVVKDAGFDLVILGKQEIDLDSGQLGPAHRGDLIGVELRRQTGSTASLQNPP